MPLPVGIGYRNYGSAEQALYPTIKTILVMDYAVNPYKGSEDGMGWQFRIACSQTVICSP